MAGDARGAEAYERELHRLAAADTRILWPGFVQGHLPEELFCHARVFIQPSDVEGLFLALLEAMNCGTPCLRDDLPELLAVLRTKSRRVVVSTDGYLTDRIADVVRQHPWIGVHNGYYFHKTDNHFTQPGAAVAALERLIDDMLASRHPKDWFRAYFNFGLIGYIRGLPRLLPCAMGSESFFLDPCGEIRPCNVTDRTMGNLRRHDFLAG
jgi:glycosyltransferase involved in cell wall biosynthesis